MKRVALLAAALSLAAAFAAAASTDDFGRFDLKTLRLRAAEAKPVPSSKVDVSVVSAGSYYHWTRTTPARCGEFTPSGVWIRGVPDAYCRSSVGSYYNWTRTTPARCGEYTPSGVWIRGVPNAYCR